MTVTYRLDDDNRFHMNWEATTDAPTIIDMSSHVYLNLNGFKNRDIMNEYLNHIIWKKMPQAPPPATSSPWKDPCSTCAPPS